MTIRAVLRSVLIGCLSILSVVGQSQDVAPKPVPGKPVVIPTIYDEDRFVATPVAASGQKLQLFTDSGGGLFLFADTVEKLNLPLTTVQQKGSDGPAIRRTPLPAFKSDASIPAVIQGDGQLFVTPRDKGNNTALHLKQDGMLGQQWFAGRVWTFDYPNKRLLWRAPGDLPAHDKKNEVKLGFQTAPSGRRNTNFARIPVEIDGETIDFLFDTGASNLLSEEVLKTMGDGRPAERAASFLTRSTFDKWKKKHPEWRALENIKTLAGNAMIEVPQITIGGFTVGPVWFTVQADHAFHTYMAQWMDKPTEGAIGGSALKYLRVTVDWPNAVAVFEKPQNER